MCHCSAFAGPLRDRPAHRFSPQERGRGAWGPGVPPGLGLPPSPARVGGRLVWCGVCVCWGGGEVAQQESLARRPFPGGFLAIKSQTPAEVLTPSKYTFPYPRPATLAQASGCAASSEAGPRPAPRVTVAGVRGAPIAVASPSSPTRKL